MARNTESDKQPSVAVTLALAITEHMGGKKKVETLSPQRCTLACTNCSCRTYAETNVYVACVVALLLLLLLFDTAP